MLCEEKQRETELLTRPHLRNQPANISLFWPHLRSRWTLIRSLEVSHELRPLSFAGFELYRRRSSTKGSNPARPVLLIPATSPVEVGTTGKPKHRQLVCTVVVAQKRRKRRRTKAQNLLETRLALPSILPVSGDATG